MQRVKIILHEADSTKQNMQYVKLFYTDRWWTLVTAFLNVFLYFPRFVTFLKTVLFLRLRFSSRAVNEA